MLTRNNQNLKDFQNGSRIPSYQDEALEPMDDSTASRQAVIKKIDQDFVAYVRNMRLFDHDQNDLYTRC